MQVVIQKSHLPHKKLEAVIDGKKTVPLVRKKRLISLFIKILKEKHDISIDIRRMRGGMILPLLASIVVGYYGINPHYKSQSMISRSVSRIFK